MNALVDPFPFVPATCTGRRASRSDGCHSELLSAISVRRNEDNPQSKAHHISDFSQPLHHLWNGAFIEGSPGIPNGFHDGMVGLERVESLNGSL